MHVYKKRKINHKQLDNFKIIKGNIVNQEYGNKIKLFNRISSIKGKIVLLPNCIFVSKRITKHFYNINTF